MANWNWKFKHVLPAHMPFHSWDKEILHEDSTISWFLPLGTSRQVLLVWPAPLTSTVFFCFFGEFFFVEENINPWIFILKVN